jgi:predicted phosphodiesterase
MKHLILTLVPALCFHFSVSAQTPIAAVDFYPPSVVPDRIIASWRDDPATSFAVNWRTSINVSKGIAQIQKAVAGPDFDSVQIKEATTELLVNDLHAAHYHSVAFSGLSPETIYAYRVGDGTIWSEWIHFTTASKSVKPFSFLYFGDAQNDLKSKWSRTIRQAFTDLPKADFMIHAGDLININKRDQEWGEWFYAGGWIYQNIPSILTPGNHEYSRISPTESKLSPHWKPSFTLPENGPPGLEETVYFTDFQGARIISLNTTAFLAHKKDSASQMEWLDKTLANNPNKWTFVTMHHPVYSPAAGRENPALKNSLKLIFDKYNVDLVLQGHDHTYARGGNNLPEGGMVMDSTGPVYVVSVSGPKMYLSSMLSWIDRAANETQLYQTIHVKGDSLTYTAYTTLGELYDQFKIIKKEGKSKIFIDEEPFGVPERIGLSQPRLDKMKEEERNFWSSRFEAYKARKMKKEENYQKSKLVKKTPKKKK